MARKAIIERSDPGGLLTRQDVANRFGVAPQTITRWANEGIIPHVRTLGGQRRYPAGDIERLLSSSWAPSGHVPPAPSQASRHYRTHAGKAENS